MFEYALLAGKTSLANEILAKLATDRSGHLSPVDPRYLVQFFELSLKNDNLDGVAHLVNYSDRYGVNLGDYPIGNFRSALNYYLNKNFDLNKVMTFLKFYQKYTSDRAASEFEKLGNNSADLSESEILQVSKGIFETSDGLVDLPAVFDFLV